MVAIRAHEVDRFLISLPAQAPAFLLFGTDAGLVSERASLLAKHPVGPSQDYPQVLRFEGDAIASDPGAFLDELNSGGLFTDARVLRVRVGSKQLMNLMGDVLRDPPDQARVLLEAGALKKDAPLRKQFEQHKNAYALECNQDSFETLSRLITTSLAADHIQITEDALDLAISLLGQDRLSTRAEIDKLKIYALESKHIDRDAVLQIVAGSQDVEQDDLIKIIFNGRLDLVGHIQSYLAGTGNDPSVFLGFLLRHAMLLHKIKTEMAGGLSLDQAVAQGGWLPFHLRQPVTQQLQRWTEEKLLRAIQILRIAMGKARSQSGSAAMIADRACWSLAQAVART